jgi:hypothetical protein
VRKRKEDQIIRSAFLDDDISGAPDGRDFAKEIGFGSPGEAKLYQEYVSLRQDLQDAWEAPDHQLSNERLRHAILGHGLKPGSIEAKPDYGWLLSGVGACGLVAIMVLAFGKHHATSAPIVDLQDSQPVAIQELKFHSEMPVLSNAPIISRGTTVSYSLAERRSAGKEENYGYRISERSGTRNLERRSFRRHALRHSDFQEAAEVDPSLEAMQMTAKNDGSEIDPGDSGTDAKAADSAPVSLTSSVTKQSASADPVVEIDQDKDKDTGARAAREIASKNVIVGG